MDIRDLTAGTELYLRVEVEGGLLGYDVTTGIGPDLMTAAKDAVRTMIDRLARDHGLDPVHAYLLCSVCVDLRISEIVDQPNWVVSFYFPRSVLS